MPLVHEIIFEAAEGVRQSFLQLGEAILIRIDVARTVFRIFHRQDILRRAYENGQRSNLVRDGLDHLDSSRPDADYADVFAFQFDRLMWPARGVENAAFEAVLAREDFAHRGGEHAATGDQELGVYGLARPRCGCSNGACLR